MTNPLSTAYRAEVRAIMALREERKLTVPNLRDFGFERIEDFHAASHAWAVEQDRLDAVAQRLHGEIVRLRTASR